MTIEYATRQAIADLPGKTVQPWRDDDARCHCTHCDLCGELYRTLDIDVHERECQAALLAAIGARTRTHCKRCTVEVCADVTLNPDGLCGHCVCDLGLVPASPAGETREAWAVRVLDAKVEDMGRPAYWKTRQRHDGHRECAFQRRVRPFSVFSCLSPWL
jgi:hypothetical protein